MRGHQLELSVSTLSQACVDRAYEGYLKAAESQTAEDRAEALRRADQMAPIRERELLALLKNGNVADARLMMLTVADLHAKLRAYRQLS